MSEDTVAEAAPAEVADAAPVDAAEPAPVAEGGESTEPEAPSLDLSQTVRVKIDGEEREVPIEELQRNYELRRASHKRMEDAAKLRKELTSKEGQLRELANAMRDPSVLPALLRNLGHEPSKIIEALQKDAAVPKEVRERQAFEEERKRFQQEKAEFERLQNERKLTAAAQREQERLTKEFNAALATHGLEGNVQVIARMAAIMERAVDAGYEIDANEAAERAIDELRDGTSKFVGTLPPEQLAKQLGPDVIRQLAELQRAEAEAKLNKPQNKLANPVRAKSVGGNEESARPLRVSEAGDDWWRKKI